MTQPAALVIHLDVANDRYTADAKRRTLKVKLTCYLTEAAAVHLLAGRPFKPSDLRIGDDILHNGQQVEVTKIGSWKDSVHGVVYGLDLLVQGKPGARVVCRE